MAQGQSAKALSSTRRAPLRLYIFKPAKKFWQPAGRTLLSGTSRHSPPGEGPSPRFRVSLVWNVIWRDKSA